MPYGWIDFITGRQTLAQRLADPSMIFWTDGELGLYLIEALRMWNALTFLWKQTFAVTIPAGKQVQWFSLGTMEGSPRLRTLTDVSLYRAMQYHLLEPASGGVWTGTSQFSLADFAGGVGRCRDELLQLIDGNQRILRNLPTKPGNRVVTFADTVLDVERVRWLADTGAPLTLVRGDRTAWAYYQSTRNQTPLSTPTQYDVASTAPLTMELDTPPVYEGVYEALVNAAGAPLAPPVATPLEAPDDLAWMVKWGALADLLSRESEATDLVRAAWCRQTYASGLALAEATPWLMQAAINEQPACPTALAEMDRYSPEWDSGGPDYSTVVLGGLDTFAVVPDPQAELSVTLTVLANAPVPASDGDAVQVSRDDWDAVLDYAQFLAAWKQGGAEFQSALELEKRFHAAATAKNAALIKLGLFGNEFVQEGQRQERAQERYPRG